MSRRVLGHLAESAVVGIGTAGWVVAAGGPAGRRRVLRALIAGAALAVPLPRPPQDRVVPDLADEGPDRHRDVRGDEDRSERTRGVGHGASSWPKLLVTVGAGTALAVVSRVLVRRVERRWLQALSAGHRHPRRALAARVGALAFLTSAASRLAGPPAQLPRPGPPARAATPRPGLVDPVGAGHPVHPATLWR